MGFTAYGRSEVLSAYFLNGGAPSTLWIALTTKVPVDSDSGTVLASQEPTGGSYARVSYTTSGGWYELAPGILGNANGIQFPTATTDWGWVRGWALCTASTAGLVIASGSLRQVRRVVSGMPVQVYTDAIRISSR